MDLELWTNNENDFGFIIEDDFIKRRVYLENHMLLEGIDASEVDTLNLVYAKELLRKKKPLDNMDFLKNEFRDCFNVNSYTDSYAELSDCIVFNQINNMFESLIIKYSDSAERYIESYDEDGNPIILGEFEFLIRKKLSVNQGIEIRIETFYEKYLYVINGSDSYLYTEFNLSAGVKKGMIVSELEAICLLNNNSN